MKKRLILIIAIVAVLISAALLIYLSTNNTPGEIDVKYIYDENYRVNLYPKSDYDDPDQYDCVLLTLNMLMRIKETPWDIFHEDVIKSSKGGCVAELLSYSEIERNGHWRFKLKETVYGDIPENEFTVIHSLRKSFDTMFEFEVGKEYFIAFDHYYSGLFDAEKYNIVGGVYIPVNELEESKWFRGDIQFSEGTRKVDLVHYFKEFAEEYGYKKSTN